MIPPATPQESISPILIALLGLTTVFGGVGFLAMNHPDIFAPLYNAVQTGSTLFQQSSKPAEVATPAPTPVALPAPIPQPVPTPEPTPVPAITPETPAKVVEEPHRARHVRHNRHAEPTKEKPNVTVVGTPEGWTAYVVDDPKSLDNLIETLPGFEAPKNIKFNESNLLILSPQTRELAAPVIEFQAAENLSYSVKVPYRQRSRDVKDGPPGALFLPLPKSPFPVRFERSSEPN